jgi:hypothetical protein
MDIQLLRLLGGDLTGFVMKLITYGMNRQCRNSSVCISYLVLICHVLHSTFQVYHVHQNLFLKICFHIKNYYLHYLVEKSMFLYVTKFVKCDCMVNLRKIPQRLFHIVRKEKIG